MAQRAEALGFDSVWTWDHLLLGSRRVFPVLDSLTTLASIGALTSKIKLGTGVLILALRNPLVVAKVLSTIQYMTKGRLVIGSASGWYEREFRATGTDFKRRGKIYEERFKLVQKLVNETDVNYESSSILLEHATLEPRSAERIPMLMGGYSDSVLSRAGRISDGWISYYYTPTDYHESWSKVESAAKDAGRDRNSLKRMNIVPLSIASTFEEADRMVKDFTSRYMDLPKNSKCTVESSVRGTIKECLEQVQEYAKAGVQDLIFIPCNYDISVVEKAAREILPAFSSE